jgi:hypothetical protein
MARRLPSAVSLMLVPFTVQRLHVAILGAKASVGCFAVLPSQPSAPFGSAEDPSAVLLASAFARSQRWPSLINL